VTSVVGSPHPDNLELVQLTPNGLADRQVGRNGRAILPAKDDQVFAFALGRSGAASVVTDGFFPVRHREDLRLARLSNGRLVKGFGTRGVSRLTLKTASSVDPVAAFANDGSLFLATGRFGGLRLDHFSRSGRYLGECERRSRC
jgi:hypothetical protein